MVAEILAFSHWMREEMAQEEAEMLVADMRTAMVSSTMKKLVLVVLNG